MQGILQNFQTPLMYSAWQPFALSIDIVAGIEDHPNRWKSTPPDLYKMRWITIMYYILLKLYSYDSYYVHVDVLYMSTLVGTQRLISIFDVSDADIFKILRRQKSLILLHCLWIFYSCFCTSYIKWQKTVYEYVMVLFLDDSCTELQMTLFIKRQHMYMKNLIWLYCNTTVGTNISILPLIMYIGTYSNVLLLLLFIDPING